MMVAMALDAILLAPYTRSFREEKGAIPSRRETLFPSPGYESDINGEIKWHRQPNKKYKVVRVAILVEEQAGSNERKHTLALIFSNRRLESRTISGIYSLSAMVRRALFVACDVVLQ
jgi:hypothetical protein